MNGKIQTEKSLEQLYIGVTKAEKEGQWGRISNTSDKDMCSEDEG